MVVSEVGAGDGRLTAGTALGGDVHRCAAVVVVGVVRPAETGVQELRRELVVQQRLRRALQAKN